MNSEMLIDSIRQAGQGQVFAFLDQLDAGARQRLLAEAAEINLGEVTRLNQTLLGTAPGEAAASPDLSPAPLILLPEHGGDVDAWAQARVRGEEALRAGRVAAFTVAGGQGTRLGYDGPKGTFPVTPVRKKPLFRVFAEKIRAAGLRYGRSLHWFIMTSQANHEATLDFFSAHGHFGLNRAQVHFFRQGRMPAVDFSGRIMLESNGSIALSPDGHGGSLRALARSGALDRMRAEGADLLSYFQVDNPLVRCLDPAFIGWHLGRQSEMSSKMVPKSSPDEKVGHFCCRDGRLVVVEYSDLLMTGQRRNETDPATGRLRFAAGNIAIHLLDREFVRRMADSPDGATLPFHRADKKIATIDTAGQPLNPAQPNGVKFELFVFDALPLARNPLVIETRREDEFSPVKNADGADSPETCRDDQLRQFARWFRAAGVPIETDASGRPALAIEVAPPFAEDEASFVAAWSRLSPQPALADGLVLE